VFYVLCCSSYSPFPLSLIPRAVRRFFRFVSPLAFRFGYLILPVASFPCRLPFLSLSRTPRVTNPLWWIVAIVSVPSARPVRDDSEILGPLLSFRSPLVHPPTS